MEIIRVAASRPYDVRIGRGLLDRAGDLIAAETAPGRAAVLTDDTVDGLYGERVAASLAAAGVQTVKLAVPAGERSKTPETLAAVLNFLAENRLCRSDLIVALGGGMAGDLAGFAAAVYLRGIPYVQIPTTLLAAVDSSVGGKTGVDLPAGKNLAGAFWQPSLVLCDPAVLDTLPERVYREGCAEVVKYGVLRGGEFFRALEVAPVRERAEEVIAACVACKRDYVAADEFDRGERQLLNLGHTVGHAVERCSGYALLHGECVAIGLAVVARAARKRGLCSGETCGRIVSLLERTGLPTATDLPARTLWEACLADKKIRGNTLRLAVPERLGGCTLREVPVPELLGWITEGLTP